jgi:hypothetical protein
LSTSRGCAPNAIRIPISAAPVTALPIRVVLMGNQPSASWLK